nr:hypothetical protein [Micromonospora sp. DSM 115978]
WLAEEVLPTVALLPEAGLHPGGTDAEAYMELSCQRYRLLRTHSWDDPVLEQLRAARRDHRGR